MIASLQWQLDQSQWWPPAEILRWQLRQLSGLATHAARDVPFYRHRLAAVAAAGDELTLERWREIPILSRSDVQSAGSDLASRTPPQGHGKSYEVSTSGSTGEPVRVLWNDVTGLLFSALTLRDHMWHGRDFAGKVAVIRRLQSPAAEAARNGRSANWGVVFPSGPMMFFDIGAPIDAAIDWLIDQQPDYLMTYPTYLKELIRRAGERSIMPARLRQVLAVGEVVEPEVREICQTEWGAPLVDMYSSQEIGMIALESPQGGNYLVRAEAVFVEVLREDGTPCSEGEIGRIVVTPMHNCAMPLIRYELGDYAEVAPPSSCGRGLPALRRILGRGRNMIALPSGERIWVRLSGTDLTAIAPLRRIQLVQQRIDELPGC